MFVSLLLLFILLKLKLEFGRIFLILESKTCWVLFLSLRLDDFNIVRLTAFYCCFCVINCSCVYGLNDHLTFVNNFSVSNASKYIFFSFSVNKFTYSLVNSLIPFFWSITVCISSATFILFLTSYCIFLTLIPLSFNQSLTYCL